MGKCHSYQSILTTDGTSMCPTDTSANKGGEIGIPGGWEDHTYQHEECICPPLCVMVRAKSVVNLSSTPLIELQETLLAQGCNFAVVPNCSLKEDYIAKVEEAYLKLPQRRLQN